MIDELGQRLVKLSTISLRRERPLYCAFLCPGAVSGPKLISEMSLRLENIDYTRKKRASVWAVLEIVSENYPQTHASLMGFDLDFFDEFARKVVECVASGADEKIACSSNGTTRVVEYITQLTSTPAKEYKFPDHILIESQPYCTRVSGVWKKNLVPKPFFQLPRSDRFMRDFQIMAYSSIAVLREALETIETLPLLLEKRDDDRTVA